MPRRVDSARKHLPKKKDYMRLGKLSKLSALLNKAQKCIEKLAKENAKAKKLTDALTRGMYYKDKVINAMDKLRAVCDEMETQTAKRYWPFPTYGELMYSVR